MNRAGRAKRRAMMALLLLTVVLFTALGVWQVQRRGWKLGLIAAVQARVEAPAHAAPPPPAWPGVTAQANLYDHVSLHGSFLPHRETLVQALTVRGAGFWVLSPLVVDGGWTVLVNRGFVPSDRRDPASRGGEVSGPVSVVGLLRLTEPGGGFLRGNDPAADLWYSRDVAAIAAKRGLGTTAPFFVDADATPNPGGYPVGGLTVIDFPNNHLVYAVTWFSLAGLGLFGLWTLRRVDAARDAP